MAKREPGVFRVAQLVAISRISAAVLQAVLIGILARDVSKESFAILLSVAAALSTIMAVSDPGLSRMAHREAARNGGGAVGFARMAEHDVLQFCFGAMLVAAGVLVWLFGGWQIVFALFGLWFAFEKISDARSALALSLDRPLIHVENLVIRRLGAVVIYVLLRSHVAPEEGYVVALAAGSLLGYLHVMLRLPTRPVAGWPSRSTLRSGVGLWSMSVATRLRNLEPVVATQVIGPSLAAPFVGIFRLSGPLRLLATSLAAALLPEAARAGRGTADISVIMRWSLVMHAVGFSLLGVFAEQAIVLTLGSDYQDSGSMLRVYLLGLWLSSGSALINAVLQGVYRERIGSIIAWTSSAAALMGVGVGALSGGAFGAAVGMSLAYGLQFMLLCVVYRRTR